MTSHSVEGTFCPCSMCKLTCHTASVYANQRRASKHVMLARPSPFYSETGGLPPEAPQLTPPAEQLVVCPVFEEYGFCPFGRICFLPHEGEKIPLVERKETIREELDRLRGKAQIQEEEEFWICDVCGFDTIDENSQGKVGEMYYYRNCPRCSLMCYFPHVTYLVDTIIDACGDDYQIFKDEIDRCREELPDILKVPLTYEAHRIASTAFAWSLVSPKHVRDALDAAYKAHPEISCIVSMGSGVGYVEHIFNRVANGVAATPRAPDPSLGVSTFQGVHACFHPNKKLPIYAFDEVALNCPYSVSVSLGGPVTLLSLPCPTSVLLLSWPPFGSPKEEQSSMAFESLEYFTQAGGQVVIYIGDVASTGDWRFHELLYTHYKLVKDYPVRREVRRWCPQDMGLIYAGNDTIGVYKVRTTPLPAPQWQWEKDPS